MLGYLTEPSVIVARVMENMGFLLNLSATKHARETIIKLVVVSGQMLSIEQIQVVYLFF